MTCLTVGECDSGLRYSSFAGAEVRKMNRRLYSYQDKEFILEPISDSVIKVTHQEQTGYFGLKKDWEAARPYTWISWESDVQEDGITASFSYSYPTPEMALQDLCGLLVREQRKQDDKRINPEERKEAARQVMREFLEELPDGGPVSDDRGRNGESVASVPPDEESESLKQLAARSRRRRVRAKALRNSVTYRHEKVRVLKEIASEDVETWQNAMQSLTDSDSDELLSFLSECLTDYDEELRTAAACVLTQMGDESVLFGFIDALAAPDIHVRYEAERAILAFDDSLPLIRHMQHFLHCKGEGKRGERLDAIEAIGELGDERAIPFLLGALYDDERNVRAEAADVLGKLGDERAVPALVHLVEGDWSRWVIFHAARALGEIGGEKAIAGLTENLPYLNPVAWDAAVNALGRIGDRRAVPHILKALPDQVDSASRAVRKTLNTLDDGNLVPGLLTDIRSDDEHKRESAALALGLLGDTRAEEPLVEALKGSSRFVAEAAAHALGRLGGEGAMQALSEAADHEDTYVRDAVKESLDRLDAAGV